MAAVACSEWPPPSVTCAACVRVGSRVPAVLGRRPAPSPASGRRGLGLAGLGPGFVSAIPCPSPSRPVRTQRRLGTSLRPERFRTRDSTIMSGTCYPEPSSVKVIPILPKNTVTAALMLGEAASVVTELNTQASSGSLAVLVRRPGGVSRDEHGHAPSQSQCFFVSVTVCLCEYVCVCVCVCVCVVHPSLQMPVRPGSAHPPKLAVGRKKIQKL
jgi:hypothetical protein